MGIIGCLNNVYRLTVILGFKILNPHIINSVWPDKPSTSPISCV